MFIICSAPMKGEGKEEELVGAPTKSPAATSTAIVPSTKQKKGGRLSLMRAMVCMVRQQSKRVAPVQPEAALPKPGSKSLPHHPPLDGRAGAAAQAGQGKEDTFHDVRLLPTSPPGSSVAGMSSYASAEDLQELAQKTEGDVVGTEEADSGEGGDDEIDSKAEEFITKFYEQMRLQRLTSVANDERMVELGV